MSMNFKIPNLIGYLIFFDEIPASAGNFVENNGVEPLTSCVQGRRSSQLS